MDLVGAWYVCDASARVVAIAGRAFPGKAAHHSEVARKVLLQHMRQVAAGSATTVSVPLQVRDRWWQAQVFAIYSPDRARVVATVGRYLPAGDRGLDSVPREAAPGEVARRGGARPRVGSWEWRAPVDVEQGRVVWSPEMFDMMGMAQPLGGDRPYPDGAWWHTGLYFDEMVGWASQVPMRMLFEHTLLENTDLLRTLQTVARVRQPQQLVTVQVAAWRDVQASGQLRVVRGISTPVDQDGGERRSVPGVATSGPGDAIAAFRTLLVDARISVALVDTGAGYLWSAPGVFANLGLYVPEDRTLRAMCHPDDLEAAEKLLRDAAGEHGNARLGHLMAVTLGPVVVRLRRADGAWLSTEFRAVGVRLTDYAGNVLVLFTPAS
ncbi:hypothetical protein [Amycolatopsis magusensis]|uniref:hypothetical protein n=1 Tax=Amycolatopsis magusensis TaxID=882444 RepID=UPI0037BB1F8C